MFETTITYDNTDGQFCFDDEIRATMNWWHGTEIDAGRTSRTHTRHITFAFGHQSDAIKASKALEGLLGNYFEPVRQIISTDEPDGPDEPKSTHPVIAFDQSQTPQQSVSDPTSNRQAGLEHRDTGPAWGQKKSSRAFQNDSAGTSRRMRANVLVQWCDEDMVEPLLRENPRERADKGFCRVPRRENSRTTNFRETADARRNADATKS